ncbi:uncharacterized protein EDB93DRAFT_639299 [Suillus bovinus]|uniref:uncharacterized protein n=1 Tax=Suillus bovinus TaxID=48563 RepID=UPI001B87996B|nr:uncharacterized protein EDB93DRAFT_639299 [Suillus bovinus]KAG2141144.1 hypothetical protein EDB93DRAFT_639299 [Suillus bovinus]
MSTPQDLPMTPLPLTSQQRDEIDRDLLEATSTFLKIINEDKEATTSDFMFMAIISQTLFRTSILLNRENMKDNLDLDMALEETLQKHPQLRAIIRHACQTRSFSRIADLKIFQKHQASDPVQSSQVEDRPDLLYDSFVRPYVGKAVDGFYEYLKNNDMKFTDGGMQRPYYAKFCSIVQSSGTGKSRLMTELRNKGVIVLYMNIRDSRDRGFPTRDLVPARILTEDTDCTQAEYTARCCAFFTAIFETLREDLDSKLPRLRSSNPDPVVKSWNDQMCDMRSNARSEFFQKVHSRYQETLAKIKIPNPGEKIDVNPAAPTAEETALKLGSMSLADENIMAPKLEGESFVTTSYDNMLMVLQRIFTEKKGEVSKNDPKLVIAFDEAHPLSNMSRKGFRPLHIIGRMINCYSNRTIAPVWVVFASTTSQVVDFSAPQSIHDSLRVAVGGQLTYPPYTHLGWDQNADPLFGTSANNVASFDHIVGFGRPLWKSIAGKHATTNILELAAQKLCKSKGFDANDANQALAILSQRFGLDICFGHPDAVSYLEKAVASYLRICFSTTEDRMWTFTGYPSEPILSCVAAIKLHGKPQDLNDVLGTLNKKVDGGMVEIGQSGELVSRLLLLLAKDLFVRKDPPEGVIRDLYYDGSGDAELIDCRKVSVIDFLEYLFGQTFWSRTVEEAKAAFQHAYINFSHWISMTEFISPPVPDQIDADSLSARCSAKEWTLRHWHRTSAVQCCHLQPLVDKMIPIYFDDPALGSDDLNRVSQMFISDKAGKNCHEHDLGLVTRTHDSIQCLSNLPYIALLLDLNVKPKLSVTFPEKEPNHAETDRCLRIYASGISQTTFPFLNQHPEVASRLRGLISRQKEAPSQTTLEALVKFGSTARLRNLQWELQDA